MKENNPQSSHHYPFIDGFRAIAIIMVLLHHARRGFDLDHMYQNSVIVLEWIYFKSKEYFGLDLTGVYHLMEQIAIKLKGILGIEIFFVISGFLITTMLLKQNLSWSTVKEFYLRRLLKIYPTYVVMVLVSLIVLAVQEPTSTGNLWKLLIIHLLFLQNYVEQHAIFGHTWSLVIIEQFYIVMPLMMLAVAALTRKPVMRVRLLVMFGLALSAVALYTRFNYIEYKIPLITWPLLSPIPYWTTVYHLDAIVMGCFLALYFKYRQHKPLNPFLMYLVWAGSVGAYGILFFGIDWSYYWGDWYLYSVGYVAFALLMIAALHGVNSLSRLKWMQWLGRHTYGIYIWHYLILMFWKQFVGIWPITLITLGYFITAISVGFISTNTIEKFFLGLRKKKSILT